MLWTNFTWYNWSTQVALCWCFFFSTPRSLSYFPGQGLNLTFWQWKPGVLTTRLPGDFLIFLLLSKSYCHKGTCTHGVYFSLTSSWTYLYFKPLSTTFGIFKIFWPWTTVRNTFTFKIEVIDALTHHTSSLALQLVSQEWLPLLLFWYLYSIVCLI